MSHCKFDLSISRKRRQLFMRWVRSRPADETGGYFNDLEKQRIQLILKDIADKFEQSLIDEASQ